MAGCPGKGQEAKPALDHQELARGILLFKASKGESLIQYDEQGAYVVWYEETDLSIYTEEEDQRKILLRLLPEDFKDGVKNIGTGIDARINRRCARKIVHYRANNQRNIAVYSKELMTIASFIKEVPYVKKKRKDTKRVLLFAARIRIGEKIYSVQLNIFDNQISGYQLYDINKITQISTTKLGVQMNSGSI